MKSQTRALIVFTLLFIFFSTPFMGPFSYFSNLITTLTSSIIGLLPLSAGWSTLLYFVFMALILSALLLIGRNRQSHYIAAVCALIEMVHHLVVCVMTKSLYPVSLPIAIGLALALFFLLLPSQRPTLYLSDAFILSIPVSMFYNGILGPLYAMFHLPEHIFSPLFLLPDQTLINRLNGHLGMPVYVYMPVIAFLALLPLLLWARGRQKG